MKLSVRRGDVWLAELDPARGHEQAGVRPVMILSTDYFNEGPAGLCVVMPMTTKDKHIMSHVPNMPGQGGLKKTGYVMCEAIRSISTERLIKRLGRVEPETMAQVEEALTILLELPRPY